MLSLTAPQPPPPAAPPSRHAVTPSQFVALPTQSLIDAGAHLTFGSDWPVAPLDPLTGIYAAVTRRTLDGANPNGWQPQEKITVAEALRSYTAENAWAGFQENKVGVLKAGALADFAVLSKDLLTTPPNEITNIKVVRTVVGGKDVFVAR